MGNWHVGHVTEQENWNVHQLIFSVQQRIIMHISIVGDLEDAKMGLHVNDAMVVDLLHVVIVMQLEKSHVLHVMEEVR